MTLADWAATIAAVMTTLSFLPQALHVIKTRDTRAISLLMYAMFATGVVFWGIYGLLVMQWAVIVANGITLVLAGIILVLKQRDVVGKPAPPTDTG